MCVYVSCCHPLFITGCIRTLILDDSHGLHGQVAIPYSSRVAFGPFSMISEIVIFVVAIPYSSRVAFGLLQQ